MTATTPLNIICNTRRMFGYFVHNTISILKSLITKFKRWRAGGYLPGDKALYSALYLKEPEVVSITRGPYFSIPMRDNGAGPYYDEYVEISTSIGILNVFKWRIQPLTDKDLKFILS